MRQNAQHYTTKVAIRFDFTWISNLWCSDNLVLWIMSQYWYQRSQRCSSTEWLLPFTTIPRRIKKLFCSAQTLKRSNGTYLFPCESDTSSLSLSSAAIVRTHREYLLPNIPYPASLSSYQGLTPNIDHGPSVGESLEIPILVHASSIGTVWILILFGKPSGQVAFLQSSKFEWRWIWIEWLMIRRYDKWAEWGVMLKCIKDQRGGGGRVPVPWGRVEGFWAKFVWSIRLINQISSFSYGKFLLEFTNGLSFFFMLVFSSQLIDHEPRKGWSQSLDKTPKATSRHDPHFSPKRNSIPEESPTVAFVGYCGALIPFVGLTAELSSFTLWGLRSNIIDWRFDHLTSFPEVWFRFVSFIWLLSMSILESKALLDVYAWHMKNGI